MGVISQDEPILSKLDRLDNMLRELEDIKGGQRSCASTPSTSDGHVDDLSPRSMEKQCRPMNAVAVETELKGSLIHRLVRLEDRVLKMEEELAEEEKNKETKKKGGLKQLVKRCVHGSNAKNKPFYYV